MAYTAEDELHKLGCRTLGLGGNNICHGLSLNIGFSEDDRRENISCIGRLSSHRHDSLYLVHVV